jgi:putative ABC transport system permease protein
MPRSFEFPLEDGQLDQAQLWVPMSLTPGELSDENEGFWGYQMVGRLKDGVTLAQAAQDVDRVARQIMRSFPASMSAIHIQGDARSCCGVCRGVMSAPCCARCSSPSPSSC